MVEVPSAIKEPNVLIVEGVEEVLFFSAFIKQLALCKIQTFSFGGKTKLRDYLPALVKTSGFSNVMSLGIVRDADSDPIGAFNSVCDALRAIGLAVPARPLEPAGHNPQVIVMILPAADKPGMLEDLCLLAVEAEKSMICVDQYFDCLNKRGLVLPTNISKAKVHAFLASKPEPDKRLGEAAQKGYWPFDNKAYKQVEIFLQNLVSL